MLKPSIIKYGILKYGNVKNFKGFLNLYMNDNDFRVVYDKLGRPKPFDVTLRDGLQSIKNVNEIQKYDLEYKIKLYHEIYSKYFPSNIEVGSQVSTKILPILANSLELLQYAENYNNGITDSISKPKNFILVPNMKNLSLILDKPFVNNFSFITSVSESFQKKNTNNDLYNTKNELDNMISLINKYKSDYSIKLYISCINECPISGKLDNDYIVNEILQYNCSNIDNICLSDTCGTLELDDFEYIVDTCNFFGIPFSKFSLHLHVKPDRKNIVKEIIHKALDRKIVIFDVSLLESGGCSVTMDENKLTPNLSYELYFESLIDYINKKK
jgi:hypothetical protein